MDGRNLAGDGDGEAGRAIAGEGEAEILVLDGWGRRWTGGGADLGGRW
jgi:hypothetical protein